MNIHHLELFYYVARHGGISHAVRNIPYGIQQPAMSGQILQLEKTLGLSLFNRRPFALTPQGEELYQFIRPFFENLKAMEDRLRGATQHLLIGGSEVVLRDHLPPVLDAARRACPKLRVTLRSGSQPQLEAWLQQGDLDLAVTLVAGKAPAGIQCIPLLQLPLVLLVPKASKVRSAEDLWQRDRIEESLICFPENDLVSRNFQQGLARLKVDWPPGLEVHSLDLVEAYVANGYGLGLSVAVPGTKSNPKIRVLPLPNFSPVTLGALWRGQQSPLLDTLVAAMKERAQTMAAVGKQ